MSNENFGDQVARIARDQISRKNEERLRKAVSDALGVKVEKSAAAQMEKDLNKRVD